MPLTAAEELKKSTIDDEIRLLRAKLPPIDYSVLDDDEEDEEEHVYDEEGRIVVCSCTFKEVIVSEEIEDPASVIKVQTDSEKQPDEFIDQGKIID